MDLIGSLIDI